MYSIVKKVKCIVKKEENIMTLRNFMKLFRGDACISIEGYCEEKRYDYYLMPKKEDEDFLGNNPNHYIPTCLAKELWWDEVKNCQVKKFLIIGGGLYQTELCIYLEKNSIGRA